jgi:hypothetical protein
MKQTYWDYIALKCCYSVRPVHVMFMQPCETDYLSLYRRIKQPVWLHYNQLEYLLQNWFAVKLFFYKNIKNSLDKVCWFIFVMVAYYKKSWNIPKVYSESLFLRMTDHTMTKRKRAKGQTTIYKTLHRKQKNEQHGLH